MLILGSVLFPGEVQLLSIDEGIFRSKYKPYGTELTGSININS